MSDLISRSALLSKIDELRRLNKASFPKRHFVVGDALQCINKARAVDAVEVVRCKDCKHLNGEYRCVNWRGLYDYTKADDFCSYGERRERA